MSELCLGYGSGKQYTTAWVLFAVGSGFIVLLP